MAKRLLATLALIVLLVAGITITAEMRPCKGTTVILPDNSVLHTEIADNYFERAKGLSNRDTLVSDAGMLFLFPSSDHYSFWMKDTRIPLDIIWLNNHTVVDMVTLEPQSGDTIPQYTPTQAADAVLEINKDMAAAHNIKAGETITWETCKNQ